MATPYMEVYNRFLSKVTDYFIFDLSDEETCNYCHGLMTSALADLSNINADLTNIDEELAQFNETLNNTEIEYVAYQMVCEWCNPQIQNTTLTRQYVGVKDERFFAPSALLTQLRGLREDSLARRKKIRRDWNLQHSDYFTN